MKFARIIASVALAIVPGLVRAKTLEPIVYTVRAPAPATHVVQVEASVPTAQRDSVDMMMAVWSPGYYVLEHYESRVRAFAAYATDGAVAAGHAARPEPLAHLQRRPCACAHPLRGAERRTLGDAQLGRRHARRTERRAHVHHARGAGASTARGAARARGPLEAVGDVARARARRPPQPLSGARLRGAGGLPHRRGRAERSRVHGRRLATRAGQRRRYGHLGRRPRSARPGGDRRAAPAFLGHAALCALCLPQPVPERRRRARAQELRSADVQRQSARPRRADISAGCSS